VVNLAGGYQLTGLDNPVSFDLAASGTKQTIGWTAPQSEDAFLWLDRNNNGIVDDGSELFGTSTPLRNGHTARNGFEALAELDANDDGAIDALDSTWTSLMLWTDRNHDGISQPDEIQPLAATSISALELNYHWAGRRDQYGNLFQFQALLHDGPRTRAFYDIFFIAARSASSQSYHPSAGCTNAIPVIADR